MPTPKISVIVPVYKVEKYLNKCVDSIVNQTFTDIEIILVDDGSPDNSGKMCDDWSQKDRRIRVIHKENGGQSDARNVGIDAATTDLLSFIDSDDFIEPDMLGTLYNLLTEHDADIAICGLCNCYKTGRFPRCTEQNVVVCDGIEAMKNALIGVRTSVEICTKLFKKDLLGDLRFSKGMTSEDAIFTPQLLLKAKRVVETPKPLYNYWHRSGSTTTRPFDERTAHVVDAYKMILKLVEENSPQLVEIARFRLFWAYFTLLDRILASPGRHDFPAYYDSIDFLRKNWREIYKCSYFRFARRISIIALKIHPILYKILFKLNHKTLAEND